MDKSQTIAYREEVKDQYAQMRTEFYEGLKDQKFIDLKVAQSRAFQVRRPVYFSASPQQFCW